jgi:TonB family protein
MKMWLVIIFAFCAVPLSAQNGIVKSYYPSGKVQTEESYVEDVRDGAFYKYYENGNLEEEKNYLSGVLNGWYRTFYESGLMREEVYLENGIRNGVDKLYYENGALAEVRSYKNGKLIRTIKLDFDPTYVAPSEAYVGSNQQIINKKNNEIICNVYQCPVPIGGMPSIERKLKYPKHARLYGLEGDVLLVAKIDTSGKVVSTEIIKKLGLGCEEAAEEAVKGTRFFPGKDKSGNLVEALATIKINFSLGSKKRIVVAEKKPTKDFSEFVSNEIFNNDVTENSGEEKKEVKETTVSEVKSKKEVRAKNSFEDIVSKSEEKQKVEVKATQNKLHVQPENQRVDKKEILQPSILCKSAECAESVGGIKAIVQHFKIPKRVKEKGIKGVVVLQAVVDKYGFVKDTKIIKGLPYGANDAAEVAVLYTEFKPAIVNGEKQESVLIISLPVVY